MLTNAELPYPVPEVLLNPGGLWVFNWAIPIFGSAVILWAAIQTIRTGRLTWSFLFLFNSLLVYWMESLGDWGQHLIYSPAFTLHHMFDWMPLKTPYDPLFMPFSYATYWTVHAWIVLVLGQFLTRRYGWTILKAMLVIAIPTNLVWDFLVEGLATYQGWWTYDPGIGPVLEWPTGGRITLLLTIGAMCTWPNLIAYWGGKPAVLGLNHIERMCGLARFTREKPSVEPTPGSSPREQYEARLNYEPTISLWKFESLRLLAWVVVFNVSFAILLVMPVMMMRVITGHGSPWIPPDIFLP
ncbi:MAG: hypothetical protein ABJA20_11580 [Novosphingobium sp.]